MSWKFRGVGDRLAEHGGANEFREDNPGSVGGFGIVGGAFPARDLAPAADSVGNISTKMMRRS